MAIYKSKHASNYTVIPNEIFDREKTNLSLGAIGLLCKFLSMPHDWVIYKTNLNKHLEIGRDKLDGYFKELQEAGYLISIKRFAENGRIEYEHIVYDKPFNGEPLTEKPDTVKPNTVKPDTVNPQLLSKEIPSKQELSKKEINTPPLIEFLAFAKETIPTKYDLLEFSLKAKYDAWVDNGWKDGNNKPIKNWKSKLKNTIPHLKEFKPTVGTSVKSNAKEII